MGNKKLLTKETQYEASIKNDLIRKALRGYKDYLDELQGYNLNIVRGLSNPGKIDTINKVIFIKKEFLDKASDAEISLLLRHELLHSLFNHVNSAIFWYAKRLGYDPAHMTKREYANVIESMGYNMSNFGEYYPAVLHNLAGDLQVSEQYDIDDDAIVHNSELMRGLSITDHPEWRGLSYGALMDAIDEENEKLEHRLDDKVYFHFDEQGNPVIEREEESEFKVSTEVNKGDIFNISLPTKDLIPIISEWFNEYNTGFSALPAAMEFNDSDIKGERDVPVIEGSYSLTKQTVSCTNNVFVYPIFSVRYLHYYQKLFDNGWINCCGLRCAVFQKDTRSHYQLIAVKPAFNCPIADQNYIEEYEDSVLYNQFEDWKRKIL